MTFALVLVTALASLESTVVSTAMPTIIGELHGLPVYSWVFSAYLLAATVTMPIYGRLADLYGRRRIMLIAISLFVAGAATCAVAQTMTQLIAARVLQGLGAGGLMPVALVVSGDLFTLRERARIQGLFSGVWGVASLAGPILGAFLTVTFGWRSIFSINLPLGVIAFVLVATKMIESRATRPDPVDVSGALLLAGGITALLLAVLQKAGGAALSPTVRVALIVAGVALLAVFARQQARREHPLIPPALFHHARTVSPYVSGVLMGTTIFGVDTFVPLFVQGARGGTAMAAGPGHPGRPDVGALRRPGRTRGRPIRLPPHRAARIDPDPARLRGPHRLRDPARPRRRDHRDLRRHRGRPRPVLDVAGPGHPARGPKSTSAAWLRASCLSSAPSGAPSASARWAGCWRRDSRAGSGPPRRPPARSSRAATPPPPPRRSAGARRRASRVHCCPSSSSCSSSPSSTSPSPRRSRATPSPRGRRLTGPAAAR